MIPENANYSTLERQQCKYNKVLNLGYWIESMYTRTCKRSTAPHKLPNNVMRNSLWKTRILWNLETSALQILHIKNSRQDELSPLISFGTDLTSSLRDFLVMYTLVVIPAAEHSFPSRRPYIWFVPLTGPAVGSVNPADRVGENIFWARANGVGFQEGQSMMMAMNDLFLSADAVVSFH